MFEANLKKLEETERFWREGVDNPNLIFIISEGEPEELQVPLFINKQKLVETILYEWSGKR